jgi:hypothetical protein
LAGKSLDCRQSFAALAVEHLNDVQPRTIGGEGIQQELAPVLADGRRGDYDEVPRGRQSVTDVGGSRAQQCLLDEHIVRLCPGLNLNANQVIILTVAKTVAKYGSMEV